MDNFRLNQNPLAAKSQTRRMEKVKRKSHKRDHKTQKQTWRRQKQKIGLFLTYSFHENITPRRQFYADLRLLTMSQFIFIKVFNEKFHPQTQ